jgi:glucokinase
MTPALALDLGGTNLRAALATETGELRMLLRRAAPRDLAEHREVTAGLIAEHRVTSVGLALPGLVEGTTARWMPNLPWLDGIDLATLWPGTRVAAANDAHFALLAEAATGAAASVRHAILLAIGTGIGSAILCDGRVVRGAGGGAVSFGWACADPAAPRDDRAGWLEAHAAGPALDRAAAELGLTDGAALVAAARSGDALAGMAVARVAQILGAALAGAVALTGAERVIVAGGVSAALDLIGPIALERLRTHLPPHLRQVTLVPARHGSDASLAGAALAAQGHPIWEDQG